MLLLYPLNIPELNGSTRVKQTHVLFKYVRLWHLIAGTCRQALRNALGLRPERPVRQQKKKLRNQLSGQIGRWVTVKACLFLISSCGDGDGFFEHLWDHYWPLELGMNIHNYQPSLMPFSQLFFPNLEMLCWEDFRGHVSSFRIARCAPCHGFDGTSFLAAILEKTWCLVFR